MIQEVDGTELDALLSDQGGTPLILDLNADWCAPCKQLSPILERLGKDTAGHLRIVQLDVDKHPDVSKRLGVRGLPSLILFKGGQEASRVVGLQSRDQLRQWMKSHQVELGLSTDEHGAEDLPELGGAFYGDEALRKFLFDRVRSASARGAIRRSRWPYWADGQGSPYAAFVESQNARVFERVTNLPVGLGAMLDFTEVSDVEDVEKLRALLPAGADVRSVPLRVMCAWLEDQAWQWNELLSEPANTLRPHWTAAVRKLLAREAVQPDEWRSISQAASSLVTKDPNQVVSEHFAGMIKLLTPAPAANEPVWIQALCAYAMYLTLVRAQWDAGLRHRDLAFESVQMSWFQRECPNPQACSEEELERVRARFEAEHADYIAEVSPRRSAAFARLEELSAPWQERLRSYLLVALKSVANA